MAGDSEDDDESSVDFLSGPDSRRRERLPLAQVGQECVAAEVLHQGTVVGLVVEAKLSLHADAARRVK